MSQKNEGVPFRSLLTPHKRYISNAGSREANDYEIKIDKRGHKSLHFVGTHDIYQEIQSYADECDIAHILARAAAGDVAALNQRSGVYADITEAPENLAEAQNSILKLSNIFDSLPAEVRAKFDNSKEKFVQLFGTEEFNKNMGWKTEEALKTEEQNFTPEAAEANKVLTPEGENK